MSFRLHALPLLALLGCGPEAPQGVDRAQATRIALSTLDPIALEIPEDSRGGVEPPGSLPLNGPWRYAGTNNAGMHKWTMPVPIRPRGLFFHNPSPGMRLVTRDDTEVKYSRSGYSKEPLWSHDKQALFIYTSKKGEPPAPGDYVFTYPKAVERERALNFAMSGATLKNDFVRASVHHDWQTRTGLLLPAPATIVWDVTVPAAGELLMQPGINLPELIDLAPSDGATLVVAIEANGAEVEVQRIELAPGEFPPTRVDLSAWAGQQARLTLRSEPGATSTADYVFVGDPVLASRVDDPHHVVLIFIDTLRVDHVGVYGYVRQTTNPNVPEESTTPRLDAWAKNAAVFEQARSVAPWTLPSTRSVLTGRQPEFYDVTETLPARLGREGYLSAMFAGNVYLSTNFEMARDWGLHTVGLWPRAQTVTDDALAWLDAFSGHDALVLVHYMDPHLPYLEPRQYRKLFAGESVGGLGEEFHLPDVRRAPTHKPEVQQYIRDRYDNNVRYATDQAARILEELGDDDIAVVFADHGEEFWDHGGFEHGHQLYDELLHVPLIVKAPGITGSRVPGNASLLDVTPTILDALGLEPGEALDGVSLLPAARGDAAALAALDTRELAFGRPLYGTEQWGVLTADAHKWMIHEAEEHAYDLNADPGERNDLLRRAPADASARYREALGKALGTPTPVVLRLNATPLRGVATDDVVVEVHVPGGIRAAWTEENSLVETSATMEPRDPAATADTDAPDTTVRFRRGFQQWGTVWIATNLPIEEASPGVRLVMSSGDERTEVAPRPGSQQTFDRSRGPLVTQAVGGRTVTLSLGVSPLPREGQAVVRGNDDEMSAELEAMGYRVNEGK